MIVSEYEQTIINGKKRISATLQLEGKTKFQSGKQVEEVFFEFPEDYEAHSELLPDPFALVAVPIATNANERLYIEGAISSTLYLNILELIHIYNWYFPKSSHLIDIECKTEKRLQMPNNKIGSFFSGGIDSLYNISELIRLNKKSGMDQVTDLWVVRGMDIALDDDKSWKSIYDRLQQLANDRIPGTKIIDITTNAELVMRGIANYNDTGFGVILGGIAKCFSSGISTALIGSYDTYEYCVPHATSPLADPLFSCDLQSIRHFSCRASRIQKIKCIYENSPDLLKDVRVCVKKESVQYNCGECEKCLRTKAELLVLDIPASETDFVNSMKVGELFKLKFPKRAEDRLYVHRFWSDILEHFIKRKMWSYAIILYLMFIKDKITYISKFFNLTHIRKSTRNIRYKIKNTYKKHVPKIL